MTVIAIRSAIVFPKIDKNRQVRTKVNHCFHHVINWCLRVVSVLVQNHVAVIICSVLVLDLHHLLERGGADSHIVCLGIIQTAVPAMHGASLVMRLMIMARPSHHTLVGLSRPDVAIEEREIAEQWP